jgi:hypothetical protein
VAVSWFDENGAMLVPYGGTDPSVVQFESLVGHFSSYSIVGVVPEPAAAAWLVSVSAALALGRSRRRKSCRRRCAV